MEKTVVTWPESQNLVEKKGFTKYCVLINSPRGIELYGSCAYLVDTNWLEDVRNGLVPNKADNDVYESELIVDYSFPEDDDYDD